MKHYVAKADLRCLNEFPCIYRRLRGEINSGFGFGFGGDSHFGAAVERECGVMEDAGGGGGGGQEAGLKLGEALGESGTLFWAAIEYFTF